MPRFVVLGALYAIMRALGVARLRGTSRRSVKRTARTSLLAPGAGIAVEAATPAPLPVPAAARGAPAGTTSGSGARASGVTKIRLLEATNWSGAVGFELATPCTHKSGSIPASIPRFGGPFPLIAHMKLALKQFFYALGKRLVAPAWAGAQQFYFPPFPHRELVFFGQQLVAAGLDNVDYLPE